VSAPFSAELRSEDQACVVVVSGEVDVEAAWRVAEVGWQAVESPAGAVVVDLTGLTFVDSSGINALVRIRNGALDAGKAFSLRNVPASIADMFKLVGLEFLLDSGG
jgi:anti-anti-sigma factor